jgi:uncharacterized membrane protein
MSTFALILICAIVSAPLAQANNYSTIAFSIYSTFRFVCHQLPERSFHLGGYKLAVCARCTGLYSGLAIATLCYPLARTLTDTNSPRRIWLLLAALPLMIDFSLGYFGVWQNTHLTRFMTGALLSAAAVFYIVPGVIALIRRREKNSGRELP